MIYLQILFLPGVRKEVGYGGEGKLCCKLIPKAKFYLLAKTNGSQSAEEEIAGWPEVGRSVDS